MNVQPRHRPALEAKLSGPLGDASKMPAWGSYSGRRQPGLRTLVDLDLNSHSPILHFTSASLSFPVCKLGTIKTLPRKVDERASTMMGIKHLAESFA